MANEPSQFPQFDLPGAEYFALAPNTHIALQGRRRLAFFTATPVSIPGATVSFNLTSAAFLPNELLETGFTQNSGIYIHKADLLFIPSDSTLKLQVLNSAFGVALTGNATSFYQLGNGLLNFSTPSSLQTVVATDRALLVTERDVELYTGSAPTGQLFATFAIGVANNDIAANAHSVTVATRFIYTRLDGLRE